VLEPSRWDFWFGFVNAKLSSKKELASDARFRTTKAASGRLGYRLAPIPVEYMIDSGNDLYLHP
jgi:hypothetical protein